jgi:acyl dehydratase
LWGLARVVSGVNRSHVPPTVPGPVIEREVPAPSAQLQQDFIKFCGGDPAHYRDVIPPHLLSQWSLPLMLAVAERLPYPPFKVINTGVNVAFLAPLPRSPRLRVRAQLLEVVEGDRSVRLVVRVATLLASGSEAVRLDLKLKVSKPRPKDTAGKAVVGRVARPEVPHVLVPDDARELARSRLRGDAGLEFARLTGDYNPIHWLRRYAQATGLRGPILHGFASMGLTFEGLTRGLLSGDPSAIAQLNVEFVRPLGLPAAVGVYHSVDRVFVGEAPAAPAYLVGEVALRTSAVK